MLKKRDNNYEELIVWNVSKEAKIAELTEEIERAESYEEMIEALKYVKKKLNERLKIKNNNGFICLFLCDYSDENRIRSSVLMKKFRSWIDEVGFRVRRDYEPGRTWSISIPEKIVEINKEIKRIQSLIQEKIQ